MGKIVNFKQIRKDGRIIEDGMTWMDIAAKGWSPERVSELRWEHENQSICIHADDGILSKILPKRDIIVVIENKNHEITKTKLYTLNADGSLKVLVSNAQLINGKIEQGVFVRYEAPRISDNHVFGAVFVRTRDSQQFVLDINAETGEQIGCAPMPPSGMPSWYPPAEVPAPEPAKVQDGYQSMGKLPVPDAERVLKELERGLIRFEAAREDRALKHMPAFQAAYGGRFGGGTLIEIWVHPEDFNAALRLREAALKLR